MFYDQPELKMQMKHYVEEAEEHIDWFMRRTKRILPHLARILLILTFLEDSYRLLTHWGIHIDYIAEIWGCYNFIAHFFIIVNIVLQLAGFFMILVHKQIRQAVVLLAVIVIAQTIIYRTMWTWPLFMRNISHMGSLLLILANYLVKLKLARDANNGLPQGYDKEDKTNDVYRVAGRVLIIFMFISVCQFFTSFSETLMTIIGLLLMGLLVAGLKTKVSAAVMVLWLVCLNFYKNAFWNFSGDKADFMRYDFFQYCSIIGGLLMLINDGPGRISMDELKKYR